MKISSHQKFVNELQAPIRRYERAQRKQQKRESDIAQGASPTIDDVTDLMRQIEEKFDEIFGSEDEE